MERDQARELTTRDTVLLITAALGGTANGRTVVQKLAYFVGLALSASLGHRPHYFGPYSSRVEDALNLAVVADELDEEVHRFQDWHGGPDVRLYVYTLTEHGRKKADALKREHPDAWERIRSAVASIERVVPDLDQKTLSSAAKTYLIVSESEEGVDQEEIPQLAEQLGWQLDPAQVEKTTELLEQLGLLALEAEAAEPAGGGRGGD